MGLRGSAIVVACGLALTGCGQAVPSSSQPVEPGWEADAETDALARADALANNLYRVGSVVPEDLGRSLTQNAEVLAWEGSADDGRSRFVVRVLGQAFETVPDGLSTTTVERTLTVCAEMRILNGNLEQPSTLVPCPPGGPIDFGPPPPTAPGLPDGLDPRLREALPTVPLGGTVDEAAVRAAVESLGLDPDIVVDIASADGTTGIAISRGGDCMVASVSPGGNGVGSPSQSSRQPGEAGGCSASDVLSGAYRDPH